ncbi:probable ATP-dependent RNA helicase DDX28 [Planococcus citri]|uniref:probable ATP-dependent RNA helicase DDX28 n=1 Tax=Planococcus citri TaxID=170843 RepID=UPI0031F73761
MLRAINRSRFLLNDSVLNNTYNVMKFRKRLNHEKPPKTFLEPDDSFELGNFENDVKPFLKHRKKAEARKILEDEVKRNEIPIIVCKNSKLNHYRNQTYDKFAPIPLASEHWRSHKFVGDHFKIKIHTRDYELQSRKEIVPFDESGLKQEILDIVKSHNVESMSEIQRLAIPAVLSGKNTLLGAETGCGKTLAYLLPILEQILVWKAKATQPSFNAPYVLILVPSRELSDQVKDFCEWFEELGIKTKALVGGNLGSKISNASFDEIDILVSTPFAVRKFIDANIYSLRNLRHTVLDEADCLLDDSFNESLTSFLHTLNLRSAPSPGKDVGVQLTMVSATLPTSISDILQDIIDVENLEMITTEKLHAVMPHITHEFIRTGRANRPSFFLHLAKKDFKKKAPSIIFCNHAETSTWVNSFLEDNGIPNILLHGEMQLHDRRGKFKSFQKGDVNTLVCTSLAARGLDTNRVEHVINYEFPSFIAEYVHRCGRTGRLSSKKSGTVTNLISGRNEIVLVQKIEMAVRTNSRLENVNPNIKRIVKYHKASDLEKKLGLLS